VEAGEFGDLLSRRGEEGRDGGAVRVVGGAGLDMLGLWCDGGSEGDSEHQLVLGEGSESGK
jgi:hypothetical protein